MKRKVLFALVVVAAIQCNVLVYANTTTSGEAVVQETQITTRGEVTEWKFRMYNGQQQKRLWSVTYNRWIGEWTAF